MPYPICLSCWVRNRTDLARIAAVQHEADLVEIRADHWQKPDWKMVRKTLSIPIVATIRAKPEEAIQERKERMESYSAALAAGCEWIDVDLEDYQHLDASIRSELFPVHGVLSMHPESEALLRARIPQMLQIPAAVYKCVLPLRYARSIRHIVEVRNIFKEAGKKCIVHAAAEGSASVRIFAGFLGNAWNYAACPIGDATAVEQPSVDTLSRWYQVKQKENRPDVIGLFGYPLQQSSGWKLHNTAFQHWGVSSRLVYLNLPDPDFFAAFRSWEPFLRGASITIPHKQTAVQICSSCTEIVRRIGVCNTIVRKDALTPVLSQREREEAWNAIVWENGQWHAENTDYLALYEILQPHQDRLFSAVIVGTGATARTALAVCQDLRIPQLFVLGRNPEKGEAIAREFQARAMTFGELSLKNFPSEPVDLLIHATPVGMFPHVHQMLPLAHFFHPELLLVEFVHNPAETLLIRTAREYGVHKIISGDRLFLKQAWKQFSIFTGVQIPEEEFASIWETVRSSA